MTASGCNSSIIWIDEIPFVRRAPSAYLVKMSAILSADDLNDFISPGVACIKPVETLPATKQVENTVGFLMGFPVASLTSSIAGHI